MRKRLREEFFDVLDEHGKSTGKVCPRSIIHRNGYFHATVHIWVINKSRSILLQKRSENKDTHPGLWDISCAGHLSAGDTPLDAAVRELNEELGISVDSHSCFQFLSRVYKSYISPDNLIKDNEFSDIYVLQIEDTTKIEFCSQEISEVKYVSAMEFEQMVAASDPDLVNHYEEYMKIIDYLKCSAG
jgi:isopentenyl-diphosphate delta-isomerase type 1